MSFIEFLEKEYNMDWNTWVKLGESTKQIDIDYVDEILDAYEKYDPENKN